MKAVTIAPSVKLSSVPPSPARSISSVSKVGLGGLCTGRPLTLAGFRQEGPVCAGRGLWHQVSFLTLSTTDGARARPAAATLNRGMDSV